MLFALLGIVAALPRSGRVLDGRPVGSVSAVVVRRASACLSTSGAGEPSCKTGGLGVSDRHRDLAGSGWCSWFEPVRTVDALFLGSR